MPPAYITDTRSEQLPKPSKDDLVHLWDVRSKTSVGPLIGFLKKGSWQVDKVSFSPDGKKLYVLYNIGGGMIPATGDAPFSERYALQLWDVETRKFIRKLKIVDFPAMAMLAPSKTISPDGSTEAKVKDDGTIILQRIK